MKKSLHILLFLLFMSGCATGDNSEYFTSSNDTQDLFLEVPKSAKAEAKYGYQVYLAILSDQRLIVQSEKNARVQKLLNTMIPYVERPYFPYTLTVLKDDRVFASSSPGGFIYVSEGMIDFCENDNHLAAVVAHELGHIQHKRMRYTMKKRIANFLQSSASSSSIAMGPAGVVVPKGIKVINNVLLREKTRQSRTMLADERALSYMNKAGYTREGLLSFLTQIATIEGEDYYKFKDYSNLRPVSADRLRNLKQLRSSRDGVL